MVEDKSLRKVARNEALYSIINDQWGLGFKHAVRLSYTCR